MHIEREGLYYVDGYDVIHDRELNSLLEDNDRKDIKPPGFRLVVSRFRIAHSARDQIDLVTDAGDLEYAYTNDDLTFFRENGLCGRATAVGKQVFQMCMWDGQYDAIQSEPAKTLWLLNDED